MKSSREASENSKKIVSQLESKNTRNYGNRKYSRRKNLIIKSLLAAVSVVTFLVLSFTLFLWFYHPGTLWSEDSAPEVVLNSSALDSNEYKIINGELFLSYDSIKERIDHSIFHDISSGRVIVTTRDKVIDMDTALLTMNINYQPVNIDSPTLYYDENPYISMNFLSPLYNLDINYLQSGIITLDDMKESYLKGVISKEISLFPDILLMADSHLNEGVFLREKPLYSSLRIKEVFPGDSIIIFHEENGWYKVRTFDGMPGYINKNNTEITGITEKVREERFFSPPWRPIGEKINLTWDPMYFTRQDMSSYETIPGLNVISPTWFHLEDEEGNITNYGSNAYVEWAHSEGLQVWALFSNNFDPDMTSVILRDFELRKKVITQIMLLSELLGVDGVNIDFENVHYDDRDYLTQFVREITPMLHEIGLTVSMDVTIRSSSPNWSMVYDRVELSRVVDYIAVMTYDEHWAASPVAGSVASIPWVREGIIRILEQVPNHKLLLGVPFYSRLWEEEILETGETRVRSTAHSMAGIRNIIEENNAEILFDENAGQNYAEYEKDGKRYRIWIEDEISMASRIEMVHEFELAGVASWRLGFEKPHIWDIIDQGLRNRP